MATAVGSELLQLSGLLRSPGLAVFQACSVREYLHPTLSIWLGKLLEAEKSQLVCGLPGHHVQLSHSFREQGPVLRAAPLDTSTQVPRCSVQLSHYHSLGSTCRLACVHRYIQTGCT